MIFAMPWSVQPPSVIMREFNVGISVCGMWVIRIKQFSSLAIIISISLQFSSFTVKIRSSRLIHIIKASSSLPYGWEQIQASISPYISRITHSCPLLNIVCTCHSRYNFICTKQHCTVLFGANEIVAGVTGTNYIQQWTGMSDSTYIWTYAGLNLLSSIGQAAGRFYNMYQTRTPNLNSKTGELKGYRYYDSKGRKLFDADYSHPAYGNPNIKFPHYHAWWLDGSRHGKNHTGYLIMILELFGRIFNWLLERKELRD